MESRFARFMIKAGTWFTLAFLYIPLALVVLYAFNDSIGQAWPIEHFTTKWFGIAWRSPDVREALAQLPGGRDGRDADGARAGERRGVRRPPVPVLRAQRRVVPRWCSRSRCPGS